MLACGRGQSWDNASNEPAAWLVFGLGCGHSREETLVDTSLVAALAHKIDGASLGPAVGTVVLLVEGTVCFAKGVMKGGTRVAAISTQ